jgi:hypothetical protein
LVVWTVGLVGGGGAWTEEGVSYFKELA